jgi:hypothetical protein
VANEELGDFSKLLNRQNSKKLQQHQAALHLVKKQPSITANELQQGSAAPLNACRLNVQRI